MRAARRAVTLTVVSTMLVSLGLHAGPAAARSRPASRPLLPSATASRYAVGVADYTLGDSAFTYPGLDFQHPERRAPVEITGEVYYPIDHTRRPHPMVVLLHGSWQTCADREAADAEHAALAAQDAWSVAHPAKDRDHPGEPNPDQHRLDAIIDHASALLNRWPCAPGTPALPSYQGFAYLGRSLAAHGITAVSISANGINSVGLGDVAVAARAALINKHLALWARLARTGGGPLARHFTDPTSGRRVAPDFRHRIDLSRVGTLGHSRGGKAVFWQAADAHRRSWPAGVTVRAMVSLAPQGLSDSEVDPVGRRNYLVTKVPFLGWLGTCDGATDTGALDYVALNAGHNRRRDLLLTVHGANHNFLNHQWSPSSGQVEADDDAAGVPRPVARYCTETAPSLPLDPAAPDSVDGPPYAQRQLTEKAQRRVATEYVTAFFLRELQGRREWEPLLTGRVTPLHRTARVETTVLRPPGRRAGGDRREPPR